MSHYTIQRGERTFQAKKLETLRELIRRGYLGPDDVVSVDGGPFRPLRTLDGLGDDSRDDDPWRSWNEAGEEVPSEAPPERDVLSDFLSGLEDTPSRSSRQQPQTTPPSPVSEAPSTFLDREEPPSLADLAAIQPDLEILSGDSLQSLDPPSPAPPEHPVNSAVPPRSDLQLVEPAPEAPLSFDNWMEEKSGGSEGRLLENFGKVDDGIVLRAERRDGINWFRLVGLVVLAAIIIAFAHTWVRTVADTAYPTEAELVARLRGDGPSIPGEVADRVDRTAPRTALDLERRLRDRVAGDVPHFGSSDELEDMMFAELMNLGTRPLSVQVNPTRLKDAGDYDRSRPVEANLWIRLSGVKENEGAPVEVIHERLALTWFVAAKYSIHGKVTLLNVKTSFGEPSPYESIRAGRELTPLWSGRGTVMELLVPQ